MTRLKRTWLCYFAAAALIIAAICVAIASSPVGATKSEEGSIDELAPIYLTELPYTVTNPSAQIDVSVNRNAVDGGELRLGPQNNIKKFKNGISFKTVSETSPVTVTIPVDGSRSFGLFTTEFGVDRSSKGSARFVFAADGVKSAPSVLGVDAFHRTYSASVKNVKTITVDVYGAAGTAVTFGAPSFYISSGNAVSMLTENITLGGWPAPLSRNANIYGDGLEIADKSYEYGFCVNSAAKFDMLIDGEYKLFTADLGIDEGITPGLNRGSITFTAQAIDGAGNVLRSVSTPTLYDYMKPYKLVMNVENAARIRFDIGDAGDGITNDMAVIASPRLTSTVGADGARLSEFTPAELSIGSGELGIDRKTDGGELTYNVNGDRFEFSDGIGLNFKSGDYADYSAAPAADNYSYVKYNIESLGAKYVEALGVMSAGGGAYVEIYADGEKIGGAKEVIGIQKGGVPVRVAASIPDGASELEIRVIAAAKNEAGTIELVNARLVGAGGLVAVSETLAQDSPYSYGYGRSPFGGELIMAGDGGATSVAGGISIAAGGDVTFSVPQAANMFNASLGTLTGHDGTATFGITVRYTDGTDKSYTSPEITRAVSPYSLSWYFGEKTPERVTLSVTGGTGVLGIFGDAEFSASSYGTVTRVADLEWSGAESGWGAVNIDKDVMGYPIEINGKTYTRGISMHAFYDPNKYAYVKTSIPAGLGYTVFSARIGVSRDAVNGGTAGSVRFYVEGDGRRLYSSNLMRVSDDAELIVVDITGIGDLKLMVDNGDGGYECDFAAWVDPVIARSASDLPAELVLDSPIDDQSVVAAGDDGFRLSGTLLGAESAEVLVNGVSVGAVEADKLGSFDKTVKVDSFGKNTVTVRAGDLSAQKNIFIAEPIAGAKTYELSTATTRMRFTPARNGVIVNDISRVGGHAWVGDASFIRLPDSIRVGGETGRAVSLDWEYVNCTYDERDYVSKKIDVFGNDYVGKLMTYTVEYTAEGGKYKLLSLWSAYKNFAAPVSHSMQLINNSGEDMYVEAADSMTVSLVRPENTGLTVSYAYKGAAYQTSYGYRLDDVNNGYDMEVFCSTDYNNGYQIDAGYMPWTSFHAGDEGLNVGVVWSDCRTHVTGTASGAYIKAGLRPRFKTVIPAGDKLLIPETFIDAYLGSIDDGSNQLKKYLFAFSMPEVNRLDDTLPSFGFNLWELLDEERRSWRMSDSKFYAGVHQLSQMGIEEITIDTYWWKDVGDWRGVHEKWQSAMSYSANYVHSLGMNFTIYMQAGNGGALHSDALTAAGINGNPNWFARGDNVSWDELCLADPDAYEYLRSYLKSYFMENGLDGIRTDFGYLLGYCAKEGHKHIDSRADVGYWTSVNWYKLLDELYEQFPVPTDVNDGSEVSYFKWENCNCGGTHKDFASMSRATRVQTTDAYDPLNVRRSFYDASYMFPSMQLMLWMNDYMYNPDGPYPNDNYRFWSQLFGSPCPMISMPSDMSPAMYESLYNSIKIYKNWMRELVKYGDLYHILPRADGVNWDGMEYFLPDTGKGAALVFKPDPNGTVSDTVTLKFDGIDPDKTYYVWSEEGYIPFATYRGSRLISGLDLTIEGSYGAEIIYFMDTAAQDAQKVTRKPDAFTVSADVKPDSVELNVNTSANADYYLFKLTKSGTPVYSFVSDEEGAICNILRGLGTGGYSLEVTAYNRFGSTVQKTDFTVSSAQEFADAAAIDGADGGDAVICGERYVGGNTLDLTDKTFAVSETRTATVATAGKNSVKLRLSLDGSDGASVVTVSFYGIAASGARTLIDTKTVTAGDRYIDATVATAGYDKLEISAKNDSPNVYIQSAVGYGRTGLYGGSLSTDYEFSFDATVLRNGLNETFPRAGGFAAYVDNNNFAAVYIDAYYSNIVIYERRGSKSSDVTTKIKMPDGFDYYANHNIKVVRSGSTFTYYVDGNIIAERTLSLAASKVALITEDAQARFANVVRKVSGTAENISWSDYNTNVDIYGKTVYSTKVTAGVWKRPEVILKMIAAF